MNKRRKEGKSPSKAKKSDLDLEVKVTAVQPLMSDLQTITLPESFPGRRSYKVKVLESLKSGQISDWFQVQELRTRPHGERFPSGKQVVLSLLLLPLIFSPKFVKKSSEKNANHYFIIIIFLDDCFFLFATLFALRHLSSGRVA